ncbi:MAG: hypothetical protein AMJ46_02990 [Latescibacteria bacterium DG_63]|nr:MAG: hypothetical protein AMJ46_02990 [Latescibacteria bacterium DG_63]
MKSVRFLVIAGLLFFSLCGQCFSADVTGRAFLNGGAGTLIFIGDEYMTGTAFDSDRKIRLYGDGGFGYVFRPYLAATINAGFGWQAYSFDDMRVATAAPFTAGVEYRHHFGKYMPRIGAGLGWYVWSVLDDRRVMKDEMTREELRRGNLGAYMSAGLDYFVRPSVAVCWDAIGHYILSEDLDAFPSGYGYNEQILVIRMGVRYYFSPQRKGL